MRIKTFFTGLLLSLIVTNAHAAVTSYDYTFVANDVFAADFHTRLNANFTRSLTGGINAITTANITDDTLTEADMADEINPRIRTYEGAACEKVYEGLLPVTGASLTVNTSAGTAYPRGYRVAKASATGHTYTASKWTFVDIDINGDFQYSEQTIGGSTPAVASNSIRLARVSSDGTTVNSVVDLRTTNCAAGPFDIIADATSEASLEDLFKNGVPLRRFSTSGRSPQGWAQGAFVSWDTHTTFKVTAGSLYINGKYRAASQDISITTSNDTPLTGISGLDTGSVTGGPVTYYVYGVADQDAVNTFSVTYSTSATAPTGVTNYRLLGLIKTDATNLFTSRDIVTVHGIDERMELSSFIHFNGTGTVAIRNAKNVSGLADNGTGLYTISWDLDYANAFYSGFGIAGGASCSNSNVHSQSAVAPLAAGTAAIGVAQSNGTDVDCEQVTFSAHGDLPK